VTRSTGGVPTDEGWMTKRGESRGEEYGGLDASLEALAGTGLEGKKNSKVVRDASKLRNEVSGRFLVSR